MMPIAGTKKPGHNMLRLNRYHVGCALFAIGLVLVLMAENPPGRGRYSWHATVGAIAMLAGGTLLVRKWMSHEGPY
jgi:hypothetical protein